MQIRPLGRHLAILVPLVLLGAVAQGCLGCGEAEPAAIVELRTRFPGEAPRVLAGEEAFVVGDESFVFQSQSEGLGARLPREGDGAVVLVLPDGAEIRVRSPGMRGAGAKAEGAVVYGREGGSSFWTAATGGIEAWLLLGPGVAEERVVATWDVEGATPRQDGGAVVLVDERGVVRVRVTTPEAHAANGREVTARLWVDEARVALGVDAGGEAALAGIRWAKEAPRAGASKGDVPAGDRPGEPSSPEVCNPFDCNDDDPCTQDLCFGDFGCFNVPVSDAPCDDGASCTTADTCVEGICVGTVDCPDPGVCKSGVCDASGACAAQNDPDDSTCDDGNACTANDACKNGVCQGMPAVTCMPLDQCHNAGVCDPQTGQCSNPPKFNGTPCNDNNVCTQNDICLNGACMGGPPVPCPPSDACHDPGVCNPQTGQCSNPIKPSGAPCNDSNLCTMNDSCQNGICVGGQPLACQAQGPCSDPGVCNPATGMCTNPPKPNGAACSDNNACTQADSCQGGVCTGSAPVVCVPLDACHDAGTCNPQTGQCSTPIKANGTPCNDNDACTLADSCQAGACLGNPMTCQAQDACHDVGVCNPLTGVCSNPVKPNGAPCNDGNLCTQNDACQGGICTAGPFLTCQPIDDCHAAGACNPQTGACSTPALPNGTPCSDGNACTQADACQGGTCVGANPVMCPPPNACQKSVSCNAQTGLCTYVDKDDGVPCDDGNPCTQNDACAQGTCAGTQKSCPAPDQCHIAGVCDPLTGACTGTLPDGYTCDDGDPCTENDACQAGTCAGAQKSCPAADACHVAGICDPATGECNGTLPDGIACDDGNPCTDADACKAGVCTGGTTKACPAPDACHEDGACDPATGACVHPNQPNGLVCDDGDACTTLDLCKDGVCTGGSPVVCPAPGACQTGEGTCDPATGECSFTAAEDGTACDDENACTRMDTCQAGACTGSELVECLPPPDDCHGDGVCNPLTGICDYPLSGTVCPDQGSISSGGGCACRSAGGPASEAGEGGWFLGLVLAGACVRRRRRRVA
ncbi:MYXO-CTERM sorting domain-containing protein [Polyangium sp. y55x31]|uniref:MYXO-CTERM sorting domain-containing protein n=1 Tax=Polyangium sp. y55x31 TaxID=3042688 RepID=UPI002482D8D8|nr:MYXO-CTERM sorting domain-containing protein [Polyangium sp. y55x31]MDI1483043.1 MYXO-CTERM sorting domain-containing protein [Polyangium sp. y55x31]